MDVLRIKCNLHKVKTIKAIELKFYTPETVLYLQ